MMQAIHNLQVKSRRATLLGLTFVTIYKNPQFKILNSLGVTPTFRLNSLPMLLPPFDHFSNDFVKRLAIGSRFVLNQDRRIRINGSFDQFVHFHVL